MIVQNGRVRIEWLDPSKYTPVQQMYIAARRTRTFDTAEEILSKAWKHLSKWAQKKENPHWEKNESKIGGVGIVDSAMANWLRLELVPKYHDSVLEFACSGLMFDVHGISLGTIRDIDRHRLFSYEEYTSRALSENLKKVHEGLLRFPIPLYWQERDREYLLDLFYEHPMRRNDQGEDKADDSLFSKMVALLSYLNNVKESKRDDAPDIYRDELPLALRTPFCLAGNLRSLGEATSKRTCGYCAHREYLDFFRMLGELITKIAPLFPSIVKRHCPMQKDPSSCCRTKWIEGLENG